MSILRGRTISLKVKRVRGVGKIKGLIGEKPASILFSTRFGIHTFGLQYPIDVLIIDTKGYVTALKKYLRSNRFFLWNPKFDTVIELPAGTIDNKKIDLGSRISLVFTK